MAELSFRNNLCPMRYEAVEGAPDETRDGAAVAGKAYWVDAADAPQPERILFHTEVDDAYAGQGVASRLVRFAVDDAIERGFRIVPVCPYVKKWLGEHAEGYAQHTAAIQLRHLQAVQARQHRSG